VRGAWRPGDRLLSSRKLADREGVSLPTALQALRVLEAEGFIVARPRSGYFVAARRLGEPTRSRPPATAQPVTIASLARTLFASRSNDMVPLGAALPDPGWLPTSDLQRALARAARKIGAKAQSYSVPPGRIDLRSQLAKRAAQWRARFGPDDLLVTSGETQAMRIALRVTCRPGDVVAVESPCYFGALLLLESMGLRALEVPTDPRNGLDVEQLEAALHRRRIAAVIASPTAQNPLGATMPADQKRRLVKLLTRHAIPLIEDDVYGDLASGDPRSPPCKAYDETWHRPLLLVSLENAGARLAVGLDRGWPVPRRRNPSAARGKPGRPTLARGRFGRIPARRRLRAVSAAVSSQSRGSRACGREPCGGQLSAWDTHRTAAGWLFALG
jgi:DNA-binding transcriptional MocR family regulator